jgi:hypothetical protein
MEFLLNAIWLVVAATLLLVWRVRWLPELRACSVNHRKWQSFIGLICVLALLFPAISLTDDLHPTEIALPDTKSAYAVAHAHDSAGPMPRSHTPSQGFAGALRLSRLRILLASDDSPVSCIQVFVLHESHCGRISGRAPPCPS